MAAWMSHSLFHFTAAHRAPSLAAPWYSWYWLHTRPNSRTPNRIRHRTGRMMANSTAATPSSREMRLLMDLMIARLPPPSFFVTDFCRPLTLPDPESERPTRPLFHALITRLLFLRKQCSGCSLPFGTRPMKVCVLT